MTDPLAEVVTLLQPRAPLSKFVSGRGRWRVRRSEAGQPFYCLVLDGACRLTVEPRASLVLRAGDFALIPAAYHYATSSLEPPATDVDRAPVARGNGEFRLGERSGAPDVRMLVGHFVFGSPDAALLVSLLPGLVLVRRERRLETIGELLRDESREQRPGREVVVSRLLEVLLIEALRSMGPTAASPGLVRALADEHLAVALRRMHARPTHPWTVAHLAKEAGLSRSTFFERFRDALGVAPMEYLLGWRMALAKDLLRRKGTTVAEVAQKVGYASSSTFSVAFARQAGQPPATYARSLIEGPAAARSPAPVPAGRDAGPLRWHGRELE